VDEPFLAVILKVFCEKQRSITARSVRKVFKRGVVSSAWAPLDRGAKLTGKLSKFGEHSGTCQLLLSHPRALCLRW
jgi:hypothetical protein